MQPLNWGDPGNPAAACGDYFPLILVQPGAVVTGGIGQGLLLALGPLSLAGDLEFEGVILGLGGVELRDAARVRGVVIARDTVRISGTASVQWSSCAANRARIGAGQPARVAGWGASHAQ